MLKVRHNISERRKAMEMSTVYNPEAELIALIERREIELRDMRRRLFRAQHPEDRHTLNRLVTELTEQVNFLQRQLAQ